MLAVHKLAKVYDVKRLFDDIDTYLKVDWGLAVTDASIRLWVAQHLQRDHVLVRERASKNPRNVLITV